MSDQLKLWLAGIGLANALLLVFSLAKSSGKNKLGMGYLSLTIIAFSALLAIELLDMIYGLVIIPLPFTLAVGPLLYLFVISTFDTDHKCQPKELIHGVPVFLSILMVAALYVLHHDNWTFETLKPYVLPTAIVQRISLFAYVFMAIKALVKHKSSFIEIQQRDADAILRWLMVFLTLIVLLTVKSLPMVIHLLGWLEQDFVGVLSVVFLVYWLGYLVIVRRSLQEGFSKARPPLVEQDQRSQLAEQLKHQLEQQKVYLDPELSLDTFSSQLSVSKNALSEVFAKELEGNFFQIVNGYRIDAFKAALQQPENQQSSILTLAYGCGFNSKAAFYRAFKTAEGMTPSAYRKQRQNNPD